MNLFTLKCIAVATMLIDHVGLFLFPQFLVLRVVGRLAFPLFAWTIGNGAHHTGNMRAYVRNLLIFGVISEIPFLFLHRLIEPTFWGLNVIFTLLLGLLAIIGIQRSPSIAIKVLVTACAMFLAHYLQADYGAWGVLSIVGFYLTHGQPVRTVIVQIGMFFLCYVAPVFLPMFDKLAMINALAGESPALLALLLVATYNGAIGPKMKYLFYWFYPVHLAVLYGVVRAVAYFQ